MAHWSEGVPTKLRNELGSPAFERNGVKHEYRIYYDSVSFDWSRTRFLSELKSNKSLLPVHAGGVYRIFVPDKSIDRCCGTDTTGTLYLGRAGTGRNWSNLRTRIKNIVEKDHHTILDLAYTKVIQKMFPWDTLVVQWAYMGERTTYNGESKPAAFLGETWLLRSYRDSFGEYPPWNQKG